MKDAKGRVIYVGKAANLRSRVSSYFHRSTELKLEAMVRRIADIDILKTATEVDALLAEARLIKDIQPKYNIQLKDDKSFTVLAITKFDDFPKVWVVRETDDVAADRYGPFTSASDLREAVKVMQRVFRFATCKIPMRADDDRRRFFRPCLLHAINRCTAPCADRISKEDYAADIDALHRFLRGERNELLDDLRRRMKEASRCLQFERAAGLRDRIRALERLATKTGQADYIEGDITPIDPRECLENLVRVLALKQTPRTMEGMDIANVQGSEAVGSVVTFVDGIPFKAGYRRYRIKTVTGIDDYAMIREVVHRRFRRLKEEGTKPSEIVLIDGGLGHLQTAARAIHEVGIEVPLLLSLAKREETLFRFGESKPVKVDRQSAGLRLMMYVRDEAHRFAQHYHHILRRKAVLEEEHD